MQPAGKLTRKQEALIGALLTAPRLTDAVQQVHISEVTAWRWLKQEAFQTAYREARRQVVQQAIVQVQQATGTAVQTLVDVMKQGDAPASAKVSAAKVVLETAVKGVELDDFEVRLAALEAAVKEHS